MKICIFNMILITMGKENKRHYLLTVYRMIGKRKLQPLIRQEYCGLAECEALPFVQAKSWIISITVQDLSAPARKVILIISVNIFFEAQS